VAPEWTSITRSGRFTVPLHAAPAAGSTEFDKYAYGASKFPPVSAFFGRTPDPSSALQTPECALDPFIGKSVSALVAWVARMTLYPAPVDFVPAGRYQCIEFLP
jgi:hypothetical protein